ncbi:unnamed protein product, partial [Symbiodinium sp. KB8]
FVERKDAGLHEMCQFNLDGVFSFGDDGKCAGPLHSHLPGPEPVPEAFSTVASSFRDLAPRLVSLCNRQCRQSGLTSAEQEDALEQLSASLRRAREPLPSCGIVFTAVPLHGRREPLEVSEGTVQPAVQEPLQLPASLYSTPAFKASSEEGSGYGPSSACQRGIDTMPFLSAILAQWGLLWWLGGGTAGEQQQHRQLLEEEEEEVEEEEEEDPLASHTIRGNFSHISATVAAAPSSESATRMTLAKCCAEHSFRPSVLPDPAKPFEVLKGADASDAAFGTNIEAAAATATAIATAVMVSQMIVQDIDDASNLCQE